jgi:ABC-2 type transport system permease protein
MMLCDKLLFSAMILIPLMITVAAGYSFRYEKLDVIPVAVVDEDVSEYSSLLLERLSGKEGLSLITTDRKTAATLLEDNEAEQVFIIQKGFEESVRIGVSDGLIELVNSASSYSAGYTSEVVAGEVIRILTANMAANNVTEHYEELGIEKGSGFWDEVYDYADAFWEPEPLMTIEYKELKAGVTKQVSQTSLPAASASSAGLIIAFITFYMLFAGGWLIEERVNGTIKRLGVGTGAIALSFQGSIIALFAAGILQIIMFTAVLRLFFGISLFSGLLSWLVLVAYLLAVIAISMFLSSVLKTQAQLQVGAPVLALLTGFIGGCFWNYVEMPQGVQVLSLFTPQGWALRALNRLLADPAALSSTTVSLLVLFAISLILLPASYMIINIQLRKGYGL